MLNKKMAAEMLYYSEDTRLKKSELIKKYPGALYIDNKKTDTQGYIVLQKIDNVDVLVIAFRGTEPKVTDWLTDINGFHVVYPYGNDKSDIQVHKGFIEAYKSVRKKIHDYMNTYFGASSGCDTKIIVCGHSLGGALATLCALDLQYNFSDKIIECYPSGNPSVGNAAFVESYNKRVPNTTRTFMRTDIVPFLPPSWFQEFTKGGYRHAGNSNPIGPFDWIVGLKNLILSRFKSKRFSADLVNHDIKLYKKYS